MSTTQLPNLRVSQAEHMLVAAVMAYFDQLENRSTDVHGVMTEHLRMKSCRRLVQIAREAEAKRTRAA